jgi:hypothetical protein
VATVRAQPTISAHGSFRRRRLRPEPGLDTAVDGMLDQVIAWSGALRGVRETTAAA